MPKDRTGKSTKQPVDQGGIVVTSQQSRFHAEAIDAPSLKDVDIKDLNISIGGFEILNHARLKIQNDTHYVFHGRNGLGKSTVLKALADRLIPGVPSNLRILLLGQTRVSSFIDEAGPVSRKEQTVLEYVTRSDVVRERALGESQRMHNPSLSSAPLTYMTGLASALESGLKSAEVIREVQLEHAQRELKDADLIASRRSGARGAKARQDLVAKEEVVKAAEGRYVKRDSVKISNVS